MRSFCTAKAPHIFWQKNGSAFTYDRLTNDIVSFEQRGQDEDSSSKTTLNSRSVYKMDLDFEECFGGENPILQQRLI